MSQSKQITIAAVLLFLLSLMNAASDISFVLAGPAAASASGGGPYALGVFNVAYSVAGMIAAFALWRNSSWGKPLALIVSALSILSILIPVISGELDAFPMTMGLIFAALYVLVIVLVLRYAPIPAASGQ
ncbi:MAG: hypothetical protein AB8I52_00655 [Candidatus Promineifilaceae bacterium]|jgi:hypothetical protein